MRLTAGRLLLNTLLSRAAAAAGITVAVVALAVIALPQVFPSRRVPQSQLRLVRVAALLRKAATAPLGLFHLRAAALVLLPVVVARKQVARAAQVLAPVWAGRLERATKVDISPPKEVMAAAVTRVPTSLAAAAVVIARQVGLERQVLRATAAMALRRLMALLTRAAAVAVVVAL